VQVNVRGGTNAGWRKVEPQRKDYTCENCGARNRYYWRTCAVCNHPRPDDE
jgi:hypothetical protein